MLMDVVFLGAGSYVAMVFEELKEKYNPVALAITIGQNTVWNTWDCLFYPSEK